MDESSNRTDLDVVLDLIEPGVARVHGNGRVEPLNDHMRSLLLRLGLAPGRCGIADLPFDAEERSVFERKLAQESAFELRASWPGVSAIVRAARLGPSGAWLWLVEDDTRLHRAEAEVRRLHRVQAVGHALQGFVHDLNNVLGVVMGLADHGAREGRADKEQRLLSGLTSAAEQATDLLRFLAEFIARGRDRHRRIELVPLVERVCTAVLGPARQVGVRVVPRLMDRPASVWGGLAEITQLLIQLVGHAIQTAGPSRRIEIVEFPDESDQVVIDVRADGDARVDEDLASMLASPDAGVSPRRLATFRGDSQGLVESWAALLLSGGRLVYRSDISGERVFRVYLPKARARSSAEGDA